MVRGELIRSADGCPTTGQEQRIDRGTVFQLQLLILLPGFVSVDAVMRAFAGHAVVLDERWVGGAST